MTMKTYVIIPLSDPPADFVDRAKSIDPEAYLDYESRAIFVRVSSSSRYIAKKMGIIPTNDNNEGYDGVVIRCRTGGMSGYGNEDLWEFIR